MGTYVKKLFTAFVQKNMKLFRMNFEIMDKTFVTKDEKETLKNTETFRTYIRDLINERKEQIAKGCASDFKDFLSVLLTDDIYSGDESLMIDECAVFFIAATQTTTALVANALYYLTMNRESEAKLLSEIYDHLKGVDDIQNISAQEWQNHLSYDNLLN